MSVILAFMRIKPVRCLGRTDEPQPKGNDRLHMIVGKRVEKRKKSQMWRDSRLWSVPLLRKRTGTR